MNKTQHQYKWQTMTQEISIEEHEAVHNTYTAALAQSMQETRNSMLRQLLDAATISDYAPKKYEIKVNFDGQE